MNAKKCDRCDEYYDKNVRESYVLAKEQVLSDELKLVDLCSRCTAELEEWFNAKKIKKVKEILDESEANSDEN